MLPNDERRAYLALALTPGIGPGRLRRLKEYNGSWSGALAAPFAFLGAIPTISTAAATAIKSADGSAVDRVLARIDELGGFVLTPLDPDYPVTLGEIPGPPSVLFGLGHRDRLLGPAVAIVGSRHPSPYGIAVTRELARIAADAGLTVVSGMARGLDAVAHWAAVPAGRTIGVLGNGLGVVYPAANRGLYERVAADGLLLTEFPPGERPTAGSFQRRNRLISGLARATVVVEAAADSGALITARTALEQGREILAVPGPITSRTSVGPNWLIRTSGAAVYREPEDLLSLYPEVDPAFLAAVRSSADRDLGRATIRSELQGILGVLDGTPRTLEGLGEELAVAPHTLIGALSELEIVGLVERDGEGFRRVP